LKDKVWPTSEHYFQAQKFVGTKHEEEIRNASTPNKSAQWGRDRKRPLRKDWEGVKDQIMFDIVYLKFKQHKHIRKVLLDTGDAYLVEHTANDSYWGDGGDGTGKNMLGKTLMLVRDKLRKELEVENKDLDGEVSKEIPSEVMEEMKEEDADDMEEEIEGEGENSGTGSEESGESNEEEGEGETAKHRRPSNKKHDSTEKKLSHGRVKARRKRGVFVEGDGSSTFEKSSETKGTVTSDGKNQVSFNEKALPPMAKFVANRNQYRLKREQQRIRDRNFEEDDEDDGEEFEQRGPSSSTLSDFIPDKVADQLSEQTPAYLLSPKSCIEESKNAVDLIKNLPPNDPALSELVNKCLEMKIVLQDFISQTDGDENLMADLFLQHESLSSVLDHLKV